MNIDPHGPGLPPANATVAGAIRRAAQVTGADFQYLLATAQVESNLNPRSAAPTSSARGLFQFIEQTWLATLKEQGPALGYRRLADAITRLPSGQYAVTEPKLYQRIMNLRFDPLTSAAMAGAFTRANAEKLTAWLGRQPSEGELYIAHFLGAHGAAKLIELAETRPATPAAAVFPGAANANPSIFFDRKGHARSAADVYRTLIGRYAVARAEVKPRLAPARATSPVAAPSSPPAAVPRPAFAPDAAPLADVVAAAQRLSSAQVAAQVADPMPVFHGLFRTGGRQAVAPLVSALWGARSSSEPPATGTAPPRSAAARAPAPDAAPPVASQGEALDLFQERPPDVRALFRGRV